MRIQTGRLRAIVHCGIVAALVLGLARNVSADDDDATATARALFNQGRAALQAGRAEIARVAFERAFQLRPAPRVAYNLGLAELKTGRFVEAARHIGLYVHQAEQVSKDERSALADAERFVGQLNITANVEGASISIDGDVVGPTPFVFLPYYVSPGRHTIRATSAGFEDIARVYDVEAGRVVEVPFILEKVQQPTQPAASASSVTKDALRDAGLNNGAKPPAASSLPVQDSGPSRPSGLTIAIASGATIAVAAGTLAVIEALRVSSTMSEIDELSARASASGTGQCVLARTPDCVQLADAADRRTEALHIMRGAAVTAMIAGGATVAAWFLWPRAGAAWHVAPVIHPSMAGAVIAGELR